MYLIEVKNWSGRFSINDAKFNLFEQTDRSRMVLWLHLQSIRKGTSVKNILLSVKGNFEYNYEFTNVHVLDLNKIRNLLETNSEQLKNNGVYLIVKI